MSENRDNTVPIFKSALSLSGQVHILLFTLAMIITLVVVREIILPDTDFRIDFERRILTNSIDPPYQYRILKPLLADFIQTIVSPVVSSPRDRHILSYSLIVAVTFLGTFHLFFIYLRQFFTEAMSTIGVLLLAIVIPLSITDYYMTGDFITLFFYTLGFLLFHRGKDHYIPLLIGIAAFNREQIIFLILFYIIYLYSEKRLNERKSVAVIAASIAVYAAVYLGLRLYFGFKPDIHTMAYHIGHNINPKNLLNRIIPLWLAQVAGFVILSIYGFKRSGRFFQLSLFSLIAYLVLFFLKGNLWELAKFLPAYLILIPISLGSLTRSKI